jgi:hypothetical protein
MVNIDKKWLIIVTLIVIVLGVLMHYVYEWSGESKIVGYISPVNESVWEHLKLLVFPLMLAVAVEIIYLSRQGKSVHNPLSALFLATAVGMIFIVATFYTYTGAFTGTSKVAIDIGTFVVAALLSSVIVHYIFRMAKINPQIETLALVALLLLSGMIFYLTYSPLDLPLFKETLEN